MDIGISLYLSTGLKKNMEILQKAKRSNIKYVFTSLHIPEDEIENYPKQVLELLMACKESELQLIVDISPRTLKTIGYPYFIQLVQENVNYIRLDYGFNHQETITLSKQFNVILNASTLINDDIDELRRLGADFSKFTACHNFYPKPLTGITIDHVIKINRKLQSLGMRTMGFVAADLTFRGPLELGLPTIEKHRQGDVIENILELHIIGETDICLIGDIDVKEKTWQKLKDLAAGFVRLKATILPEYSFIKERIHHDRLDTSMYVIRSQESRGYAAIGEKIVPMAAMPRGKGSISISNELYARYSGELEIARIDLPLEEKVNIIGQVMDESIRYLPYICNDIGFKLE